MSPLKFNTFINISTMIYTILMLASNHVNVHIKKRLKKLNKNIQENENKNIMSIKNKAK